MESLGGSRPSSRRGRQPLAGGRLPNILIKLSGQPYEIKEILVRRGARWEHPSLRVATGFLYALFTLRSVYAVLLNFGCCHGLCEVDALATIYTDDSDSESFL